MRYPPSTAPRRNHGRVSSSSGVAFDACKERRKKNGMAAKEVEPQGANELEPPSRPPFLCQFPGSDQCFDRAG